MESRRPHDPIILGDLALPAAAFSYVALGAMELLRGVGGTACFTAQVGPAGVPAVDARLTANACGHAVVEGDLLRLHPAAGQTPGVPRLMERRSCTPRCWRARSADDPLEANLRNVVDLMGAAADSSGSIHFGVPLERGSRVSHETSVDTRQCFIVSEREGRGITLRAAARRRI